MFKNALNALFDSSVEPREATPDMEPVQLQADEVSILDDTAMNAHDTAFLNLFGESTSMEGTDPFSDYVAEQLERILIAPQVIFRELPIMPASITTLLSELQNDEFNVDALLEVIESEAGVAADVIKLANSPRYKRSEKSITDLKAAFMNIGAQGLIEGVIESYIKEFTPSFNIYWRHFGQNIWSHSVQSAEFAKILVKNTDLESELATAYFIGLIRNLGRMITFQMMIEAFRHVDPDASPNSSGFKKLIHKYETRLTFSIAHFWQLPEIIQTALAFQISEKLESTGLGIVVLEANYLSELQCLLNAGSIDNETFIRCTQSHLTTNSARQMAAQLLNEKEFSTQE